MIIEEAHVLRRRLELLETLDEMIKASIRNQPFLDVDGGEIQTSEFQNVATPSDVSNSIREIYPMRRFQKENLDFFVPEKNCFASRFIYKKEHSYETLPKEIRKRPYSSNYHSNFRNPQR